MITQVILLIMDLGSAAYILNVYKGNLFCPLILEYICGSTVEIKANISLYPTIPLRY